MANGFNDVGFLGDDLDSWHDSVHAEFLESFAIADRMNRMGMRMIHEFPDGEQPEAQVLAITGFYRALQSFQSTVLRPCTPLLRSRHRDWRPAQSRRYRQEVA